MENVNVGKVGRFYEKIVDWFDSESQKTVFVIVSIILASIIIISIFSMNGDYEYSEQEYIQLENKLETILVDDKCIDMSKISDKNIHYSETYTKYKEQEEWTYCEITVNNLNAKVTATITKNEDNTLDLNISYPVKGEYMCEAIFNTIVAIFAVSVINLLVLYISLIIFILIIWIIKSIEKAILNRKKTT